MWNFWKFVLYNLQLIRECRAFTRRLKQPQLKILFWNSKQIELCVRDQHHQLSLRA